MAGWGFFLRLRCFFSSGSRCCCFFPSAPLVVARPILCGGSGSPLEKQLGMPGRRVYPMDPVGLMDSMNSMNYMNFMDPMDPVGLMDPMDPVGLMEHACPNSGSILRSLGLGAEGKTT